MFMYLVPLMLVLFSEKNTKLICSLVALTQASLRRGAMGFPPDSCLYVCRLWVCDERTYQFSSASSGQNGNVWCQGSGCLVAVAHTVVFPPFFPYSNPASQLKGRVVAFFMVFHLGSGHWDSSLLFGRGVDDKVLLVGPLFRRNNADNDSYQKELREIGKEGTKSRFQSSAVGRKILGVFDGVGGLRSFYLVVGNLVSYSGVASVTQKPGCPLSRDPLKRCTAQEAGQEAHQTSPGKFSSPRKL